MDETYDCLHVLDTSWLETPISSAASECHPLETATDIIPEYDILLGASFSSQDARSLFGAQTTTAAVSNFRIPNAVLDTDYMLLLQGGKIIPETAYMMNEEDFVNAQFRQFRADVRREPITQLRDDRDYIIGCNRSHTNYYHWLIQALPSIDLSIRSRPRSREVALILPDLRPWQAQTLRLLGLDRVERVRLNKGPFYFLPSVEFSEFLSGRVAFSVSRSAVATFQRLKDATPYSTPVHDIIYIARTDSQQRVMSNESELIKRLLNEGVAVVVPGRMPVTQQINLFRGARAVIGGHGAGLSNLVFCSPGTIVYELIPTNYRNACFNRLAQAVGARYRADLFEGVGDKVDVHSQRWRVDIDVVVGTLREIRQSLTGSLPRAETAMEYLRRAQTSKPPASAPEAPSRRSRPPTIGLGVFSRVVRAIFRRAW
jgi:capsular polysaccharide biosynthesis protein